MKFDRPAERHLDALFRLWIEAFGEPEFWNGFRKNVFDSGMCRCALLEDIPVGALFIMDCEVRGQKMAYLYAVATASSRRGMGICRRLMADTREYLRNKGYAGAILVPADGPLREMYAKMGFTNCTRSRAFIAAASDTPAEVFPLDSADYAQLRKGFLPEGGVVQSGVHMRLLETMAEMWRSEGCVFAAAVYGDTLHVFEILGDTVRAADIVKAFDCNRGEFRTIGEEEEFAMFSPLVEEAARPEYFGLAFE